MYDGARLHRTEQMFNFTDEYVGNRVIVLNYPKFLGACMDCHPYSHDLTPCDFFFVGHIEKHCLPVYREHPNTLDEFESLICMASEPIFAQTLHALMSNFYCWFAPPLYGERRTFRKDCKVIANSACRGLVYLCSLVQAAQRHLLAVFVTTLLKRIKGASKEVEKTGKITMHGHEMKSTFVSKHDTEKKTPKMCLGALIF